MMSMRLAAAARRILAAVLDLQRCSSCRAWCRSDRIAVHWFVDHGDEAP